LWRVIQPFIFTSLNVPICSVLKVGEVKTKVSRGQTEPNFHTGSFAEKWSFAVHKTLSPYVESGMYTNRNKISTFFYRTSHD
jgi:hypothetical protein